MSVFHLKYRPQKFEDLDLQEIGAKLKKIISSDNFPQSYLFAGPKGAGKTSAARILAKSINCLKSKDGEPCLKCENCMAVNENRAIDIMEIDAASNRGIDDARTLKDKSYLLPVKLKYKVFIIDEVHMLTKEAFNALLKLIEEPPKHTIFIMCTTDWEKIPETILSRLVKIDFRKGKESELLTSLKKIIKGEKIKIDEVATKMVVEKSDGSFRNLQKMFNEIVLDLGSEIDSKKLKKFFENKFGEYREVDFERGLLNKNSKEIINKLEVMAKLGSDMQVYRNNLLKYFQNRIVGERGGWEIGELIKWIDLLIVAGEKEKLVEIEQLPLELAVVKFLENEKRVIGNVVIKDVEEKSSLAKATEGLKKVTGNLTIEEVTEKWKDLMTAIKPYNHSVEAFLRATRPIKIENGVIVFEVFYKFHKERLEDVKNRIIVESGLSKVFGQNYGFSCVLGKSMVEAFRIDSKELVRKEVSENDIYTTAKEIFG